MSIFKHHSISAQKSRICILLAVICFIVFIFPINTYAQTEEVTEGTESSGLVFSENLYHKHSGNSTNGGGCYTVEKTGTREEEKPCPGTMVYWPDLGSTSCSVCGASYYGDQSWRACWKTQTETVAYKYYERGCKMNETTVLATVTLTKNTDEWTRRVLLTGTYELNQKILLDELPYIWNDQEASAQNVFEATSCGSYSFQLSTAKKTNFQGGKVTALINNVDVTPPVATVECDESAYVQSMEIAVKAQDLQPDGTDGCGLAQEAYSFDGGITWGSKPGFVVTENGVLSVAVRDNLDNITYIEKEIGNIDNEAPIVDTRVEITGEGKDMQVKLVVEASDEQSGLPENPYSWDKGVTYTNEPFLLVNKNGNYPVMVCDKVGNIKTESIKVSVFKTKPEEPEDKPFPPEENPDPGTGGEPEEPSVPPGVLEPEPEESIEIVTETEEIVTETETEEVESEEPTETEETSEKESEEWTTEEVVVSMEELIEEASPGKIKQLDKNKWDVRDTLLVVAILVVVLGILFLALLLWMRTIAMYAKDRKGQLQYIGRLWIHHKDEHYEVRVTESVIEQCETNRFEFRPTELFLNLHRGEEIHFLFNGGVCVTLTVDSKMKTALL